MQLKGEAARLARSANPTFPRPATRGRSFRFDMGGWGGYERGFAFISQPPCNMTLSPAQASSPVEDPSLLTLARIFSEPKEFRPESWGPAHWLKDGKGFPTLEVSVAL